MKTRFLPYEPARFEMYLLTLEFHRFELWGVKGGYRGVPRGTPMIGAVWSFFGFFSHFVSVGGRIWTTHEVKGVLGVPPDR